MTFAEKSKTMRAHAKINLCLYVLKRRDDGYHNIKSLMQTVEFGDEVTVTHTQKTGIVLKTNDASCRLTKKILPIARRRSCKRHFACPVVF